MMNNKDNKVSVLFMLFSILFCVCLIAANVLETKQIAFGKISLTGGLIVFPVSYIINDCVCEVWGYKKTRMLIWTGFAMNFFFVMLGAICDMIPGAPYWTNDEGFHAVFGLAPRIAFASFLAFICGSFVNAYVMSKMKLSSGGQNFSLRAVEELPWLMLWQVFLKTAYEVVVLPLTIRIVRYVKRHEQVDTYDNDVNYSIWRVFSI